MPDFCTPSATAVLIKPERSRLLPAWWLGLHFGISLGFFMGSGLLGTAMVPLLLAHLHYRWPRTPGLIVVSGTVVSLPAEGRFGLVLAPECRAGYLCLTLRFGGHPGLRRHVLRDQLAPADWRRLHLLLTEMI